MVAEAAVHASSTIWIWYLVGAFTTLVWKWLRWCVTGAKPPSSKSWGRSTKEWFSVHLTEDQVSWGTTIGIVWVAGAVYVERLPYLWEWLRNFPQDDSVAFLLGTFMEIVAPSLAKWLLGRLSSN